MKGFLAQVFSVVSRATLKCTFFEEKIEMCLIVTVDSYLSVYAVILFILASPGAQRETAIAATNRLTVMTAPCFCLKALIVMV